MQKIRSDRTGPEILLQKLLRKEKIKFKKNCSNLPGAPDVVIPKRKVAVFVDGEFWHGYRWEEKKKKLKANRKYWIPKIERNIARDWHNNKELKKDGWQVIRLWQHQLQKDATKCLKKIRNAMKKSSE